MRTPERSGIFKGLLETKRGITPNRWTADPTCGRAERQTRALRRSGVNEKKNRTRPRDSRSAPGLGPGTPLGPGTESWEGDLETKATAITLSELPATATDAYKVSFAWHRAATHANPAGVMPRLVPKSLPSLFRDRHRQRHVDEGPGCGHHAII